MVRPWRLTRQAEASLTEIARWTLDAFGPRQAAAYEDDLITCCREIAAGASVSYDCGQLADPDAVETLRFARAGQHFVIFIGDAEQVIVIDFLHARSDLPRRLAALRDAPR